MPPSLFATGATECYPGSCPGNPAGTLDHVEPIYGIFSNMPLDDPTVYADDVILHLSDQDQMPYYRWVCTKAGSMHRAGQFGALVWGWFGVRVVSPS